MKIITFPRNTSITLSDIEVSNSFTFDYNYTDALYNYISDFKTNFSIFTGGEKVINNHKVIEKTGVKLLVPIKPKINFLRMPLHFSECGGFFLIYSYDKFKI